MIDSLNLDPNILIPVFVTVLGFISYFFGKIISETLPGTEEKSQNYIFGFIFVLIYLILPITIIYYFNSYLLLKLNLFLGIIFFLVLCCIMKYLDIKKKVHDLFKGQVYEEFEKESFRITNQITSKWNASWANKNRSPIFKWLFTRTPSKISLFILTFMEIFLASSIIYSSNIIFGVILFILIVTSMSDVAVLSVAKNINYKEVILMDKDRKVYNGRILKYGKEFISIRNKREVYNFPRENVIYVRVIEKLPLGNPPHATEMKPKT